MTMKPTKPRVWTEDEIKLLMELAHLKKSAPIIAKQLGRYTREQYLPKAEIGSLERIECLACEDSSKRK